MRWIPIICVIIAGIWLYQEKRSVSIAPSAPDAETSTAPPHNNPKNSVSITFDGRSYILIYEKISGKKMVLIPNFDQKLSAARIAEQHSCTIASSGGFYTPENKPVGLFKVDNKELGRLSSNRSLLTGFLYSLNNGTIGIDSTIPEQAPTVLQAGPIFEDSGYFPTRQDEYARRIVIIEDTRGDEYVGAVVSVNSTHEGPLLSDLPPLLFSISSPFQANRVLNLDGGSASFFKDSNGFSLSELTVVGSILCFQ